ncbi:MAG: sporulation protein YtxC [Christensenellales bacterium]|jgi:putative sporulation protein YtxC
MDYFIGVEDKDYELEDILKARCEYIMPSGISYRIYPREREYFCKISLEDRTGRCSKFKEMALEAIASIATCTLAEDVVETELMKLTARRYPQLDAQDRAQIFCYAWCKMKNDPAWMLALRNGVKNELVERGEVMLEALLRFRLKELRYQWEGYMDRAHNKIMVEREYLEFVKLLRYFVEIQSPRIEEIHIYVDAGEYHLFDKDGQLLDENQAGGVIRDISDYMSEEDILLSTLITLAPVRIIVFGAESAPSPEIIETICRVFGERVEYGASST